MTPLTLRALRLFGPTPQPDPPREETTRRLAEALADAALANASRGAVCALRNSGLPKHDEGKVRKS